MAVDRYANDRIEKDKLAESVEVAGNKTITMIQTVDFTTDDVKDSIIRLFKVGANLIPVSLKVITEKITGAAVNIGIYEEDGKALDNDALGSAVSLNAASTPAAPVEGLNALTVDTFGKKVYELAGHTVSDKDTGYDIALELTAAASAGKAKFIAVFVQG